MSKVVKGEFSNLSGTGTRRMFDSNTGEFVGLIIKVTGRDILTRELTIYLTAGHGVQPPEQQGDKKNEIYI